MNQRNVSFQQIQNQLYSLAAIAAHETSALLQQCRAPTFLRRGTMECRFVVCVSSIQCSRSKHMDCARCNQEDREKWSSNQINHDLILAQSVTTRISSIIPLDLLAVCFSIERLRLRTEGAVVFMLLLRPRESIERVKEVVPS